MKIQPLVLILLLVLAGCDTYVTTARVQTIMVHTPYVENAECVFTDKRGSKWMLFSSPGVVTVKVGNPPLHVECTKYGYKKTLAQVYEEPVDFDHYPGFLEEAVGFAQDPYGRIATKYPDEIKVFIEPHEWASDERMREFFFEKKIYENQMEAKKYAIAMEKKRLDELERKLKVEKEERMKQQRKDIFNSRWFRWMGLGDRSRRSPDYGEYKNQYGVESPVEEMDRKEEESGAQ